MGVWELRTDGQAGPGHRRDADDLGQRYPGDERGFDKLYMDRKPIKHTVGGSAGSKTRKLLVWSESTEKAPKLTGTPLSLF